MVPSVDPLSPPPELGSVLNIRGGAPLSYPSPPAAAVRTHTPPLAVNQATTTPAMATLGVLAPPLTSPPPPPTVPLFTFTQGILLGQASMIILAVLFLKYVVLEDPDTAARARDAQRRVRADSGAELDGEDAGSARKGRRSKGGKGKPAARASPPADAPTAAAAAAPPSAAALLSSLAYDLSTHPPESLDWLNVLSAQLISSYRTLAAAHPAGGARALIEQALNRPRTGDSTEQGAQAAGGMVGLDFIDVDEVELGQGFPTLGDARVRPSGVGGESVRVEIDLDYVDRVVLSVSTRVVLHFPRPRFAVLPVSLSLTLERFSGTLTVELPPPTPSLAAPRPSSSSSASSLAAASPDSQPSPVHHAHPTVHLSLHPDFELQLATSSLLGSRAKLQDVPKIEQLLVARIRAAIQDRVVWPGRVEVALPALAHHHRHHHHHHHHHHAHDPSRLDNGDGTTTIPSGTADGLGPARSPESLTSPLDPTSPPPFPTPPLSPTSSSSYAAAAPLGRTAAPGRPLRHPLLSRTTTTTTISTTGTGSGADTPTVDLSGPDGPSIALHPRVRPAAPPRVRSPSSRSPSYDEDDVNESPESLDAAFPPSREFGDGGGEGVFSPAAAATPSPSESLPGYFPPWPASLARASAGAGGGVGAGLSRMDKDRTGPGGPGVGQGIRFRGGVGTGTGTVTTGVGMGVGVGGSGRRR